jgi:hypothetical protein
MPADGLRRGLAAGALVALVACSSSGEHASQSASDARRDQVPPKVAALTVADRVEVQRANSAPFKRASAKATDGTWVASQLHVDLIDNCTYHVPDGDIYYCSTDWGEVLLRDSSGKIKRAYPLPGLPPQYISVGPDAVYCARQGDGGLPNSMVCRIDRKTLKMTVRVFPSSIDSGIDPKAYWPKSWTLDTRELAVSELTLDPRGLRVGDSMYLDPETLKILT